MISDFWKVMVFYAGFSCFFMPLLISHFKGYSGLGMGYVIGTIISLILWFVIGHKYAKIQPF
jgi:hypothetical protein